MCHPSTWVNKKASPSFEVIKSPKGINQETELHQPHADMMFRCFWSRPFVRHLYPMEGRTYGSPPAGRSGWLEWLETKPRQRYRDLKIWMRRTPKWSIFGEKPCDQNLGPFFLFLRHLPNMLEKDSSSYFAGLPFKRISFFNVLWVMNIG